MNLIPTNSIKFLKENKLATICFVDEKNHPYCINCFYEFDEKNNYLILKSSNTSKHLTVQKSPNYIAGTILPEVIDALNLKGIQFAGRIIDNLKIEMLQLKSKYVKRFPLSIAKMGSIWVIKLEFMKHTDNILGFGKSIVWNL